MSHPYHQLLPDTFGGGASTSGRNFCVGLAERTLQRFVGPGQGQVDRIVSFDVAGSGMGRPGRMCGTGWAKVPTFCRTGPGTGLDRVVRFMGPVSKNTVF